MKEDLREIAEDEVTEDINNLIKKFEGRIQKSLYQTIYQEREDLAQEIRLKIVEKLNSVEFKETPSFWSLVQLN